MNDLNVTDGEWKVHEYNKPHWNNESLPHITIWYGDNEEHIVDTVYDRNDAYLIAQAKNMYEMLNQVNEFICESKNEIDLADMVCGIAHNIDELLNACKPPIDTKTNSDKL